MRTYTRLLFFALLILSLILLTKPAGAFVREAWDWHSVSGNPKRTIHYCAGVAVDFEDDGETVDVKKVSQGLPLSWAGWLSEAVDTINNANTGWTLIPSRLSFPPCQILISLADISEANYGGGVSTPVDLDGDGNIDLTRVTIDKNLEGVLENLPESQDTTDGSRDGWSTTNGEATRNPMGVLMHELLHALRLDHHADSKQNDASDNDISDPRQPGDHKVSLSDEDLNELRLSSGQEIKVGLFEVEEGGQKIEYGGVTIEIPSGAYAFYPGFLDVNIYDGVLIPDPLILPDEYAHVFGSGTVYIRTDQPLQKPIKVYIPYTDEELKGGQGMYVGDLHEYVPPAIDEKTMAAFKYVMRPFGVETEETNHWELVGNSQVDSKNNSVVFETSETGIFGISGFALAEQPSAAKDNRLIFVVVAVGIIAIAIYLTKFKK